MHKLRNLANPSQTVGNPVNYHFSVCANIEADRGIGQFCQIDSSFELDDFMSSELGQTTPTRDNPSPNDEASTKALVTPPPYHPPFVYQPSSSVPYSWLSVDPDLDM